MDLTINIKPVREPQNIAGKNRKRVKSKKPKWFSSKC